MNFNHKRFFLLLVLLLLPLLPLLWLFTCMCVDVRFGHEDEEERKKKISDGKTNRIKNDDAKIIASFFYALCTMAICQFGVYCVGTGRNRLLVVGLWVNSLSTKQNDENELKKKNTKKQFALAGTHATTHNAMMKTHSYSLSLSHTHTRTHTFCGPIWLTTG